MNKIEELIQKHVDPHVFIKGYEGLEEAMKEYAEYYARKVLEVAIREANVIDVSWGAGECEVDPDSIINIKLPEHE